MMVRYILVAAGCILAVGAFGISALLLAPLSPSGRLVHWFARYFSRTVLWISGVRVEVEGLEHLNRPGSFVIMANHKSMFDIPATFAYLPVQFRQTAKQSLFRIPILGWCMHLAGYISIDRANPRKALQSIKKAAVKIRQGLPILYYPEGTRSPDGRLQPFKSGGFRLALEAGVPLVPLVIHDSERIVSKGSLKINSGTIHITILSPIDVAPYQPKGRLRLMADVHRMMAEALGEDGQTGM